MDLLRLRSFVEAARLGSFAAAAEALGYTAPAISQHVAHLENELRCELFVRGARGVRPTAPGTALLSGADRLLAEAEVTALAVREAAGQLRSLRVGSFPSAAERLVPDALARLRDNHPDLELSLTDFEPPDGLAQLADGAVDIVITHRYPGISWYAPVGVRTSPLITDLLMLMVPDGHPVSRRQRVEIEQLRSETFISGTATDPNRVALATAAASAGFSPHVAFETNDYAATANLVRNGFGIAVVPQLAWPAAGTGLRRLDLHANGGPLARQLLLAVRTGRRSALLTELVGHLVAASSVSQRL